jgi:signal transduction histidine kinase
MTHQVFVAFVLGGMIAGSVGLLAARMGVFLSFVGPTAVPIIARLLTFAEGPASVMAGMAGLFTLVIVFTGWKFHKIIDSGLRLRFENSELVATLASEKAVVEQLNGQLRGEIEERKSVEAALMVAQSELEQKVKERTSQLESAIAQLRGEMEQRQRLDEQLQQAQKMESVGRLAGGIAHDFNNLLTVMLGYAELARSTALNQVALETYLEGIQNTAQRASDLTQQLLAFSRRQIINPEVVSLNHLLFDMLPMLRRVINENIELITVPSPALWTTWADPGEIQRVIINLVLNARDAMPQGGKLTVATENLYVDHFGTESYPDVIPGDYSLLTVKDTGIGIPEDIKAHIFEPFFTTKGVGEGTGLGLSICYGIITQIGGFMAVDSEVGKGTTIRVFLPRVEGESRTSEQKAKFKHLPKGNETVLVVEDEIILRHLVCQVLESHGYRVLQAANGAEAIESTRSAMEPVDLLITDIVMPQMGGVELARLTRTKWPNIRILFISGYTNAADIKEMVSIGGESLRKPFLPHQLVVKVREVLDDTPSLTIYT